MKHLILGIDGTWRAAFQDTFHSNVYRLNLALNFCDADKNPQVFMYSSGVGTSGPSSRLPGGALGEGLDAIVLQAYINLVANYERGDKIYIFGFSRGALAARALTGLITYSGLLKADSSWLIEHAWRHFTDKPQLVPYQLQMGDHIHRDAKIEFLGLWDTVSGPYRQKHLFKRFRFRNLALDPCVRRGIQILSIDESRGHYRPIIWTHRGDDDQVMEQIWMPGVHTDVGGGFSESFLSTLSLLLMIDKITSFCPALKFDDDYVRKNLITIIKRTNIVINNDWVHRWFHRAIGMSRHVEDHEVERHFSQHPVTRLIQGKAIRMRNLESEYVPQFRLHSKQMHLKDTNFGGSSYHAEIADVLREKFP